MAKTKKKAKKNREHRITVRLNDQEFKSVRDTMRIYKCSVSQAIRKLLS